MESSRVNTNGERNGYAMTEENPTPTATLTPNPVATAYRRGASQSETSHRQPDAFSSFHEELFRYRPAVDYQTLVTSIGNLSVRDSSVRHHVPSLDNRWINQSSSSSTSLQYQGINGGGVGYGDLNPHHEINSQHSLQRFSTQNDSVNGGSFRYDGQSSSSGGMLNNGGFLNGDSRDVPSFSRDRYWAPDNGFGFVPVPWRSDDRSLSLENFLGRPMVWLAKEQHSSLLLQKKIDGGSRETIDVIFDGVISHISELMVDPFGQYVIQKLMEKSSSENITRIVNLITQKHFEFATICIDPVGTRSIQSLLDCLTTEDQVLRMVDAISTGALTFIRSTNAKHVILQCFSQFNPSQNRSLLEVIDRNCYQIAIDQHGCCMLQQCLTSDCQVLKHRLITSIITNAFRLCLNCYGNYVVQYVVELKDPNVTLALVKQLAGHYAFLSRDKYGSHAVQKFLKIEYIDSSLIICDLLSDIDTLLLDPFGNYVIQTAWLVCKDDLRSSLMRHIELNKPMMRCNKFGNKVLQKLNLYPM